jgi:hypothetical protein
MRRHTTVGTLVAVLGLLVSLGNAFARPVLMERTAFDTEAPIGTAGPYNPSTPSPAPRF